MAKKEMMHVKEELGDPVCGMDGDPRIQSRYMDATFFFCSEECKREFQREPERYLEISGPER